VYLEKLKTLMDLELKELNNIGGTDD
jgi:hypothetical protein